MALDDPVLTVALVFPVALVGIGLGFVFWAATARLPVDVETDVLAALSETEALPVPKICKRPPLDGQRLDPATVRFALEHLRRTGRAVRWYTHAPEAEAPSRQAVYRRVA